MNAAVYTVKPLYIHHKKYWKFGDIVWHVILNKRIQFGDIVWHVILNKRIQLYFYKMLTNLTFTLFNFHYFQYFLMAYIQWFVCIPKFLGISLHIVYSITSTCHLFIS